VRLDADRLQSRGIALGDVMDAISKNNANAGGNFIEHGADQYVVRGIGLAENVRDIGNIVLSADKGVPVYLRDVAEVQIGPELRQGAVDGDGKGEIVAGIIIQRLGANTKQVIEAVKARIAEFSHTLPAGVRIEPIYDQAELVDRSVNTAARALIEGEVLVLIILLVLLGDFRSSVIAALAIPACMLVAFALLWYFNISANLMSLSGLALSVGMMVDATVVIVENIYRHVSEQRRPGAKIEDVVLEGALEIARPVFFAILAIIAVFIPVFALQDVEGKLFHPLAASVVFSMVGSVLMALAIAPSLCASWLRSGRHAPTNALVHTLQNLYRGPLEAAVRRPAWTMAVGGLVLLASFALFPLTGSEFLPTLDEGNFRVRATLPPSVSLPAALDISRIIEQQILALPEAKRTVAYIGRPDLGGDPESVSNVETYVRLRPRSEWRPGVSKEDLTAQLRARLGKMPGIEFNFSQELQTRIDEILSGAKADVVVKIFGDDLNELRRQAAEVKKALGSVRGATDLSIEQVSGVAQLSVKVNRERIARYGINVGDVMDVVETAIGSKAAGQLLEGNRRFDINVRLQKRYRVDETAIRNILVSAPSGLRVPLGELADVRITQGVAEIGRENTARFITVNCGVKGRDLGGFVADAQRAVGAGVRLPSGYYIRWGGQFENQQRALGRLAIAVPLSFLLVFALIYLCFGSLSNTWVILANVPLAIVGGTALLVIMGLHLNVPAYVGFIAKFGIGVQNGMIMVAFMNHLRRSGMPLHEATVHASIVRLRPELLSALIGSIGLIPFLIASGTGAEVARPLAAVVIGGIIVSRPLSLLVLPALYRWTEGRAQKPGSPPEAGAVAPSN
jgi:cobalt-zinc-cadmium resistance protein CzcA